MADFREVGTYARHGRLDGAWRDVAIVVIVERLLGGGGGVSLAEDDYNRVCIQT